MKVYFYNLIIFHLSFDPGLSVEWHEQLTRTGCVDETLHYFGQGVVRCPTIRVLPLLVPLDWPESTGHRAAAPGSPLTPATQGIRRCDVNWESGQSALQK